MASGPTTSWQIDGETVKDFIFLGFKITAHGDCSHEINRCLLFGRKAMKNLDSMLKSRDITLSTKVHLVKAMVFPVLMYGCEMWTIKKAERWRIDAFELWCWRRLLRVARTAKRSNQSILKEISAEYSLEGLMLKLKLQYSVTWCKELTHWKRPVVHIHNGVLLSRKKEFIWISSDEMDETGANYTEWGKPGRKT